MTDPSKSVHPTDEYVPSAALVDYCWRNLGNVPRLYHDDGRPLSNLGAALVLTVQYLADPAHADDLRAFADATMEVVAMGEQELGTYSITNEDTGAGSIFEPGDTLYRVKTDS